MDPVVFLVLGVTEVPPSHASTQYLNLNLKMSLRHDTFAFLSG